MYQSLESRKTRKAWTEEKQHFESIGNEFYKTDERQQVMNSKNSINHMQDKYKEATPRVSQSEI